MQGLLADIWMTIQILFGTFLILTVGFNFNPSWPRFRWDMTVDKFGFHAYIPIVTSLVIAVLVSMLLRLLNANLFTSPF